MQTILKFQKDTHMLQIKSKLEIKQEINLDNCKISSN